MSSANEEHPEQLPSQLGEVCRDIARGFAQLLFPASCWVCQQLLQAEEKHFCRACRAALTSDAHSTCPRCAGTVGPFVNLDQGCARCRDIAYHFDSAIRLGPYQGLLREVVLRMKYAGNETLAEVLGELWADHALDRLKALGADVVVPVPLHWLRRLRRGYNQSAVLARALAARLKLPCRPSWLRRIRHTPQQTLQSPAGRRENVRGAFCAYARAALQGKAVLLVDDVFTTGSTASEAARALREAGAQRVAVAVLAHG